MDMKKIEEAAKRLTEAEFAIAFTGAGVSTESGIPDFRSPSGLWTRFDPQIYATREAFKADPNRVWEMFTAVDDLLDATPNAGHFALAHLEARGGLQGVITQNIDGLHTLAGSKRVVEYHGNHRILVCPACGHRQARNGLKFKHFPPLCEAIIHERKCGATIRPDIVLFGEWIPEKALSASAKLLESADLVLVLGTSCEVYPAASIPNAVRNRGGTIIEINIQPAEHLRPDVLIQEKFSRAMPLLLRAWETKK